MLHTHFFLVFLLSCISNILLPAQSATQSENQYKYIKPTALYEKEIPEDINNEGLQGRSGQARNADIFTEEDVEEMELVFESSPEKAQDIVKYLQDPSYFPSGVNFRSAFFVGEPGSGKTMTAQAIAYKMAQEGWEYKIISSRSLLKKEYPHQTAILLRDALNDAVSSNNPTIIVIDRLNILLENTGKRHHDNDMTTAVLCDFLDKHKYNKKLFFIGIMNRANKLPKRFKDRVLGGYVQFPTSNFDN